MTLAVVVILGLVVYRAARVLTVDKISQPWRDWLLRQVQHAGAETRSAARWAYTLLTCPWCLGIYLSALVVAFYSLVVADRWLGWEYPLGLLAVAGAQSLFTAADLKLTEGTDD